MMNVIGKGCWFVHDGIEDRRYQFNTMDSAITWAKELRRSYKMVIRNPITVFFRNYDEKCHWDREWLVSDWDEED